MKLTYSNDFERLESVDRKFANLPLINIEINGYRITMIFDTGASMTVINESAFKKADVIRNGKEVKSAGNLGEKFISNTKVIKEIVMGNHRIMHPEVVVLEDSKLNFGHDEFGNALQVDGFLGWDIIKKFSWIIDRINNEIGISTSSHTTNDTNIFWDNMPIVPVMIDNDSCFFGLDTGNTESMLGKNFDTSLSKTYYEKDLIVGIDGKEEVEVKKLEALNVSISNINIELNNLTVLDRDVFPTTHYKVQGLLGSDLIENRVLRLDYRNGFFSIE